MILAQRETMLVLKSVEMTPGGPVDGRGSGGDGGLLV